VPVPFLAPPEGYRGPRRSLVLAGGGMRVAYQAGALLALGQAGVCFAHADGTSGGTMNLAMLLSGQSGEEMCERWRTLDPRGFVSPLPIRDYVRSLRWPALGGAEGIVSKVFPHLGIDPSVVHRASGMIGTFNVCDYANKLNQVVEHTDVDLDLLVAAISLPVLMPAVRRAGRLYTDSVWIRDANVLEAVRRESDEVWLLWCIGNTQRYQNGAFRQYVHMIEMSANGSLFEDFDRAREMSTRRPRPDGPVRLHVIRPEYPIPLDPDYLLGRVDASTLIGLGYNDARRYLEGMDEAGVPWDPEATRMRDPALGGAYRLTMEGPFALGIADPELGAEKGGANGSVLRLHAAVGLNLDRLGHRPLRAALNGHLSAPGSKGDVPICDGVLEVDAPRGGRGADQLRFSLSFSQGGRDQSLSGSLESGPPGAGPVLAVRLHEGREPTGPPTGAGVLPLGRSQAWQVMRTLHATNAGSFGERVRADVDLGRFLVSATRGAGGGPR
jgi:predicted patatin/cPLA2 family phospholipase